MRDDSKQRYASERDDFRPELEVQFSGFGLGDKTQYLVALH